MLFHSIEFVLLFLIVWWPAVFGNSLVRRIALLLASYIFYMWFSVPLVGLLVFSSVLDFLVGRWMYQTDDPARRRIFLLMSLTGNLGMLFLFKYFNFFTGTLNSLSQVFTDQAPIPHYDIILPMGISFYTFQTLSYTIDIYRKQLKPTNSLLTFALYVAFFPQLVAGPIVRARDLIPQLVRGVKFGPNQLRYGLGLFVFGLVKKTVIADNLAVYVDQVFANPAAYSGFEVLVGVYAFAFQIYCDFSGYTDMARGVAFLLGYDIKLNFNFPYFASSVREFWRRWHISLSTWLRDYLYIPLGGNRGARANHLRNIMITMLLGGLWHGANWTFVIWGGIHGIWIVIEHLRRRAIVQPTGWPYVIRAVLTFHGVCLTWIFFRAQSLSEALQMIRQLTAGFDVTHIPVSVGVYILLMLAADVIYAKTSFSQFILRQPLLYWIFIFSGIFTYMIFGNIAGGDFVYFQF